MLVRAQSSGHAAVNFFGNSPKAYPGLNIYWMDVIRFSEFIKENVMMTVLDCVIDERGNIYNGENPDFPLMKGYIQKEKTPNVSIKYIIGDDKKIYPAGIDKNGNLVSKNRDERGYLIDEEGARIPIPEWVKSSYGISAWKFDRDYSKMVPMVSTGWVNTKIDMEVIKKVRRYSRGLGNMPGLDGFTRKLEELQRISEDRISKGKKRRNIIQKEMSVIMLLHYINEIKNFFTPSASGFLFESFLGGMIKNSKVVEDNSKADIWANGETWQIKLYDGVSSSSLPIAYMSPGIPVDNFVIALKFAERIEIIVLKGKEEHKEDPLYYEKFAASANSFSLSKLKATSLKYSIELLGIEQKIESIAEGLKESIEDIYSDLSRFQYNIESIITGVDEKGKLINEAKFDETYSDSLEIAKGLDEKITSLYMTIKSEPGA